MGFIFGVIMPGVPPLLVLLPSNKSSRLPADDVDLSDPFAVVDPGTARRLLAVSVLFVTLPSAAAAASSLACLAAAAARATASAFFTAICAFRTSSALAFRLALLSAARRSAWEGPFEDDLAIAAAF